MRLNNFQIEPNYEFSYDVNDAQTNDVKEQAERRLGDRVDGHYSVVEPDGTSLTVQYTADDRDGFNAIVTRYGDAGHPVTHLRNHGATDHTRVTPLPSYSQHYTNPYSRQEWVVPGSSYAVIKDVIPNQAGSYSEDFTPPLVAHGEVSDEDYGRPFTAYHHSKRRLRHGYGGYY
jgi:hypothetical protein